jgi:putative tributyrin esterase
MGGYAAIKFSLKYPDLFVVAGSLSGALDAPDDLDQLRPEFRQKLLEVFGPSGDETRKENDVFLLLKNPQVHHPYFYIACGTIDFFLATNRAFTQQLWSQNVPYEFHETPGGHGWDYWDKELPPMLDAIERQINRP